MELLDDRLHGFRRRETAINEHLCATLFADKAVMHIISEIAKEYADMFVWTCFTRVDDEKVIGSGLFAREQMTLFYDDKSSLNGGMEINFYLRDENKVIVEIVAMSAHESGNDDEQVFNKKWELNEDNRVWLEIILNLYILHYIKVYKESGVARLISNEAEFNEKIRLREEREKQLVDEITPLVMAKLPAETIEFLKNNPTANYHFSLGLWIRNEFLHHRKDLFDKGDMIEPDGLSGAIIQRILSQLIPGYNPNAGCDCDNDLI